ncbi:MAG TPA: tetratricopeptide repeat protein [Aggregicoccus sp.]|nr:tetratricopeptide repeat protein [Aggregicoccus sp.]
MPRILPSLLLSLALGCASKPASTRGAAPPPAAVQEAPAGRFLTPAQMLERMEASPVKYEVREGDAPPGGWAEQLWPERVAPRLYPRVVVEEGVRTLAPHHDEPESQRLLQEAEPHYQAGRLDEAAKLYARATEACPRCTDAWIFRGDAALFSEKKEEALAHYRKASELNPDDYRGHFFQGHTLARMGRRAEAREAFASALVLHPRLPTLRKLLAVNPQFGLVVTPDVVVPRGFAERTAGGVTVTFDGHYGTSWLAFAACKALWLGEPSHRKELTGSESAGRFTSTEELECLRAALIGYEAAKQRKDAEPPLRDEGLERLGKIVEAGMADALVLFELAARVHPQATLTVDDATRAKLRRYVLEYVLLERE